MHSFDFSTIVDRTDSLSVKYAPDAIRSICNNAQAMPFWVADMDFSVPPSVSQALAGQVSHGVLGYPYFTNLRQNFCYWSAKRHAWDISLNRIAIGPGMLTSLALMVELFSSPDTTIIIPMPAYKPFVKMAQALKRPWTEWPLEYDEISHRFSFDLEKLESLLKANPSSLLLFCSPHNPTGHVSSDYELDTIASLAKKYNTMVLSDEIHADLTYPSTVHIPFDVAARRQGCRAVTCMAPSKSFNISGEHYCGVVCTDVEDCKAFIDRMQTLFLGPSLLSSVTASAAYAEGYEWLMQLTEYLEHNALHIASFLRDNHTGLHAVVPSASFIGLIDCTEIFERVRKDASRFPRLYDPATSREGGLLSRFFGQRAGIALNDGSWFGSGYDHFVRFNFGTSRQKIDQALENISKAISML